jgi:predicted MFS family arabinose efflux permease
MSLLHQRGFALLCTGQCLSMLADWGLRTLVLIWIYQLTHAGLAVSAVGLAQALPLLLLAPLAGVYVDRWRRNHILAGAALCRAALLLALLAVNGRAGVPAIIVVALLANVAAQFFQPAVLAAIPAVVGTERAGEANSLLGLVQGGVGITGPGLAAGLFALAGPHGALIVLSGLYLLAAPVLLGVPAPRPARGSRRAPSVPREMAEGLRYVRRSSLLGGLLLCAVVFNLGAGGLSVLDVVFATRALHLRAETAGVLLMANGLGGVAGGLLMTVASRWVRRYYHRLLGLTVLANGLAYVAYALAPSLAAATVALTLVGLAFMPALICYQTIVQLASAAAVRGRVLSIFSTGIAAGMLASLSCTGLVIDLWGVRAVIGAAATMILACGLLCCALVRVPPVPEEGAAAETRDGTPVVSPLTADGVA